MTKAQQEELKTEDMVCGPSIGDPLVCRRWSVHENERDNSRIRNSVAGRGQSQDGKLT